MLRDLATNLKVSRAISPVSAADNTALVSQIIDVKGFDALAFLIALGSIADVDATFAVTVTESDASNMAGANAVAADELTGTLVGASFNFAADDTCKKIGYIGSKRYVQLTITPANNTSAALISVVALQQRAHIRPIGQ